MSKAVKKYDTLIVKLLRMFIDLFKVYGLI